MSTYARMQNVAPEGTMEPHAENAAREEAGTARLSRGSQQSQGGSVLTGEVSPVQQQFPRRGSNTFL